jgi:hypothetical protein
VAGALVSGWMRHVVVDTANWQKMTMPDSISDGLRAFASADAEQLSSSA